MYHKLKSVKTWIMIWLVVLVSFIVIANRETFLPVATAAMVPVTGLVAVNYLQKKLYKEKGANEK